MLKLTKWAEWLREYSPRLIPRGARVRFRADPPGVLLTVGSPIVSCAGATSPALDPTLAI